MSDLFKRRYVVINHFVCAQSLHVLDILTNSGGKDVRAFQLRQLHGKGSDATSSSMNKHLLPFLQSASFKQSLPGSCSCKWHSRRLHIVERLRLRGEHLTNYHGILGIGSAVSAHEAVHILADAEVCHFL